MTTNWCEYRAFCANRNLLLQQMKNFAVVGDWVQFHMCGMHKKSNPQGMCPDGCAQCKKENAKLANYPFQPVEYGNSRNCHDAYERSQSDDQRPRKVRDSVSS